MSNFPLYDNMFKDIKNKDLTIKQKTDFINKVKNIDDDGSELIYALIRVFEMENSENCGSYKLPYCGTYIKKNMKFDLDKLPVKLKQGLYKFVKAHTQKMDEENKLKQHRLT
jgi:hypothetical protein